MKSRSKAEPKGKSSLSEWNTAEHLKLYRDSFTELLKLSDFNGQKEKHLDEDVSFIYNTLRDDICRKCPKFRVCFTGNDKYTHDMEKRIKELVLHYLSSDSLADGNFSAFGNMCIYFDSLKQELSWVSRIWFQNELWKSRWYSQHQIVEDFLYAGRYMLENCIRQLESATRIKKATRWQLNRVLLKRGGYVYDGREWTDTDRKPVILLDMRLFSGWRADELSERVSKIYQSPLSLMLPEEWIPAGRHRFLLSGENHFRIIFGKSYCSKRGEDYCGDTFSYFHKNQDQVVLCLCDGMGTGEQARISSTRLIEAFEALLLAGTDEKTAVNLLHSVLFLSAKKNLSTLDITSVSLKSGIAGFIKAGGASTFIKRENKVERIDNNNPPPGYLGEPDVDLRYKKLYDGDMIIMLSDGMLAFEGQKGDINSMEELIGRIHTDNAQIFADNLMELIAEVTGEAEDDRTVLVASISERGKKIHVDRSRSLYT